MASRGRDQICAVSAFDDGILLETLRYNNEVKSPKEVFSSIPEVKVDKEMLELATELIERKASAFQPEKFKSHYMTALKDLIDEKRKKGKVTAATDEELGQSSNVIDLMDALRKSVAKRGGETRTHTAAAAPARRKPARKATPRKAAKRKAG